MCHVSFYFPMNSFASSSAQPVSTDSYPPFPAAMMTAAADELTDVPLTVVEGELPQVLHGHVLIVAPVGSVTSNGLPNPDGTHVWNGNGMVYRLDFDQPGMAKLQTKLMKSPCYYADLATRPGSAYESSGFGDYGMARFSAALGMRNQLNTAFLAMKFAADEPERLLVTFDGGRPYEIDPLTLELVTPVGSNQEWRSGMPVNFIFPPVLSTAHPAFDAVTGEMFTVNYGRSLLNFIETIPLLYQLEELPQELEVLLSGLSNFFQEQTWLRSIVTPLLKLGHNLSQDLQRLVAKALGLEDFVYLIRWDGKGNLERWKLVLPDGTPARIEQTVHQVGVTQDYVILMDTSLKFGLEQILNNPVPQSKEVERVLRSLLTRPQSPNTTLYLVRRDRLIDGQFPASSDREVTVLAQKVTLPLESAHFLVDYENPQNRITLHTAHECATDVSEWVRRYDRSAYSPERNLPSALEGMIAVGAMDVGRLGKYVIDAETAEVIESVVVADTKRMWGLGLYTLRDQLQAKQPPAKITHLYWQSLGFWHELLSEFIYHLYQDYPHRAIPIDQVLQVPEQGKGRPSCLLCVDTETMAIVDAYEFPLRTIDQTAWDTHVVNSPQFVPKLVPQSVPQTNSEPERADADGATNGYLVCPVISQHHKEIWIFAADNLAKGPCCKLSHPSLNFGYTIHSVWLPQLSSRTASYCIPVQQDYEQLVKPKSLKIQQLFEQEVYPHFDSTPVPRL